MRYRDKTVLITGAASGFGHLAAQRFAAEGAQLSLSDIAEEGLNEVAEGLRAGGAEVEACRADVAQDGDMETQVAATLSRFGRLDVAVNNAGVAHALGRLADLPFEVFQRMMAVNAGGAFLSMKSQLPVMAEQRAGAILNVSSAAGLLGAPLLSAYAASKHAIIGLTRAAADEYARRGVRINALCPSFAVTPLLDELADAVAAAANSDRQAAYDQITSRIPMRRVATADEVVQAMLWICCDENSFMTGQAVSIDGGLTAV